MNRFKVPRYRIEDNKIVTQWTKIQPFKEQYPLVVDLTEVNRGRIILTHCAKITNETYMQLYY